MARLKAGFPRSPVRVSPLCPFCSSHTGSPNAGSFEGFDLGIKPFEELDIFSD
jgi:hypothetical protein